MMKLDIDKRRTMFGLTTIVALTMLGCASTMNGDEGGSQMSVGLTEARTGLTKTQTAVDSFTANSRQSGIAEISDGMGMMDHGHD
jgi:hypothetical protein